MTSDLHGRTRRIVSSNGRSWDTTAQGAADYIFHPVFMSYFCMCVVLYATLMQPSEEATLNALAQTVLWAGLVMTALVWLFASAWLSVIALDRGLTKAIYTPLLLLPMVFINVFMGEFILSSFNSAFENSLGTQIEDVVKNVIILVTFDIMHARFVVPQHPRNVEYRATILSEAAPPEPVEIAAQSANSYAPAPVAMPSMVDTVSEITPPDIHSAECQRHIEIAREKIDATAILWLKSEDHYLSIQLKDRNVMLRGKLRTAVDELGEHLGAQINRSVWVAFTAIRSVDEQTNGNLDVLLEDDTMFRVSNSRRLIFMQNYDRFQAGNKVSDLA